MVTYCPIHRNRQDCWAGGLLSSFIQGERAVFGLGSLRCSRKRAGRCRRGQRERV